MPPLATHEACQQRKRTIARSTRTEQEQQAHFDGMAERYQAHYADRYSLEYRDRFINEALFAGLPLAGQKILDAACGSGETTAYLRARNARVTGIDISPEMIDSFRLKFPDCAAVRGSIFATGFEDESFDSVSIVGGLHHFHPDLSLAIDEIHRILKPGGYFCFCEPPTGTLPDIARRFWYRRDTAMFAENEGPIDADALLREYAGRFELVSQEFGGNVAYMLVLNSLVLRIPLAAKRRYAPALMAAESLLARIQPRWLSCFIVGQWRKVGR